MDGTGNAYQTARSGGKHHGWYLLQRRLSAESIRRAIASFRQRIAEHEEMIRSPATRYPDFEQWDERRRRNLVEHHWPADIRRHREFIQILEGVLNERTANAD